ncbi:MAG: general secretion pathway protein GspB [Pseudomonadales bacterium]|nr:general secretion pathway protein GspB [Pseudomonadales bacterium]
MSYILDALRKSDQERQRDCAPALRSVHAQFNSSRQPRAMRLRWLWVAALVLAGIGVGAWFGGGGVGGWFAAPAEDPLATIAGKVQPESDTAAAVVAQAERPAVITTAPLQPVAEPKAPATLLEIWQLSDAEQRFLQELKVSLHIYSSEPLQRTVIINGFRVREGQPLGQDLSLVEITADGIIVDFQNQRVHLATVESL